MIKYSWKLQSWCFKDDFSEVYKVLIDKIFIIFSYNGLSKFFEEITIVFLEAGDSIKFTFHCYVRIIHQELINYIGDWQILITGLKMGTILKIILLNQNYFLVSIPNCL